MMERRLVLLGGTAAVAAGALAACGSSGSSDSATATPDDAPQDAPVGVDASLSTDEVPVGGGVILSDEKIVVVQPEAGAFAAFTAVCPHQGCLVTSVEANEIICACHDSRFSSFDGSVLRGPAQEGLTSAALSVDGTQITAG
jgi:Rieske Fe-S protein